jgi:hypothetical protein
MVTSQDIYEFVLGCTEEDAKLIRKWAHKRYITFKKDGVIVKPRPTPWAMDMAEILYKLSSENYPRVKEPDLAAWAYDIDKLNRIDKQDTTLIEGIMKWSQTDDFWKQQIRSGQALRRHFEKLYIAGKAKYDTRKGKVHHV